MQFSPKLKKAMVEIEAIIKKHDIAASVVLHTPFNGEHKLFIQPSWSCVSEVSDKHVRVKAKLEDYPTQLARDKSLTETSNMLNILANLTGNQALALMSVSDMVDSKIGAEHTDRGHTSQTTQDN